MSEPTAKELVREIHDMPPAEDAANIGLILSSRVEKVLALHEENYCACGCSKPGGPGHRCNGCMKGWPCPTVRILNGEDI